MTGLSLAAIAIKPTFTFFISICAILNPLSRLRWYIYTSSEAPNQPSQRLPVVTVSFSKMKVTRNGEFVAFTAQEFKTLKFMLQNAERVVSREELLSKVWGYQNYPTTRTVDNHILKLRQKLEREPSSPVHFLTVHSAGYKFVP